MFPFGHNSYGTTEKKLIGTGKYIDGKEILQEWYYNEWKCKRCGKITYF